MTMARSTITINTMFNSPVETFCGEDSLTVFSSVVPEQGKKKGKYLSSCFFKKRRLNEPKTVLMDTKTIKRADKVKLITH